MINFAPLSNLDDIQRQQALIAQLMQDQTPRQTVGQHIGGAISDIGLAFADAANQRRASQATQQNQAALAQYLQGQPGDGGGEPVMPMGLAPEQIEKLVLINQMAPELAVQMLAQMEPPQPAPMDAPKMRDRLVGEERVFEEWNPRTGQWEQLSAGPAFRPSDTTKIDVHPAAQPQQEFVDIQGVPHRILRDESGAATGVEPLAGTDPALARAQSELKEAGRKGTALRRADAINAEIQDSIKLLRGGAGGRIFGSVPDVIQGPDTFELQRRIDSIRSTVSLAEIEGMRERSETGGALGQVPVQQQMMVSDSLGSLDIRQGREAMERTLGNVARAFAEAVYGSDPEIDAAVKLGKLAPEQAEIGRRKRDEMIASALTIQEPSASSGEAPAKPGPDATAEDLIQFYSQGGRF